MSVLTALGIIKKSGEAVGGIASKVSDGIAKVSTIKSGNVAERDNAVQESYRAEFDHNGGWFNNFMDGINRTPRPMMAYGVMFLFTIFIVDPAHGVEIAAAWEKVPEALWWILGTVICFYFGGRILEKGRGK